jgi:hypothetical protein
MTTSGTKKLTAIKPIPMYQAMSGGTLIRSRVPPAMKVAIQTMNVNLLGALSGGLRLPFAHA